tara:strand:- start:72 stop:1397 length:1326 start_codon:yes stop_codon:yes gene_type:complete
MSGIDMNKDSRDTNIVPIMRIAEVIELDNSLKSGRLKVKITGVDDSETESSLIWCTPLLPLYLSTRPKPGELVFVFQYENNSASPTASFKTKRFWVGPLITQSTKLEGQGYIDAQEILPDGPGKLKAPKIENGLYDIIYGKNDDIILQGRYNTDIIQKNREIWLRVGKFVEGKNTEFNSKDIGYIQLKYGGEELKRETEDKEIINYITPSPEIVIYVDMKTITTVGVVLDNKSPEERFKESDIDRTELRIKVYNIKSGEKIAEFENETDYTGTSSRQLALNAAQTFINTNKGSKWQIKSDSSDIIKIYKGEGNIAQFTSEPIEVKKKIKAVKFSKNKDKKASVINVVATKINLLSNADGANTFELANSKNLISDEEQEKINNNAHPLVYGDTLVEFLKLIKNYVISHVHPYNGLPADPSKSTTDVMGFDLNTILNKNINSN